MLFQYKSHLVYLSGFGFFINFTFMKYLLLLLLFSCQNYKIHEANLIEQNKTMLKFDEQSRKKQQKIRDSRKKRVKVYKKRLLIQ